MNCENKNKLLDLFYNEERAFEHNEIRKHVESCKNCREYLTSLKDTMSLLDKIDDLEPSPHILANILEEVSPSASVVVKPEKENSAIPIVHIAFGQVFLFALIYIIKSELTMLPFWDIIKDNWFVQFIGGYGAAAVIVLGVGAFIALSIAPILMIDSEKNKNYSLNKSI